MFNRFMALIFRWILLLLVSVSLSTTMTADSWFDPGDDSDDDIEVIVEPDEDDTIVVPPRGCQCGCGEPECTCSSSLMSKALADFMPSLGSLDEELIKSALSTVSYSASNERRVYIEFNTAEQCRYCPAAEADIIQFLVPAGWVMGDHIRKVDRTATFQTDQKPLPSFVLFVDGVERFRFNGYPGWKALADKYNELSKNLPVKNAPPAQFSNQPVNLNVGRLPEWVSMETLKTVRDVLIMLQGSALKMQSAKHTIGNTTFKIPSGASGMLSSRAGTAIITFTGRPTVTLLGYSQSIESLVVGEDYVTLVLPGIIPDLTLSVGK